MTHEPRKARTTAPRAAILADHPALDLLNTTFLIEGSLHDSWQSDDDVKDWMVRAGLAQASSGAARGLLRVGRELRETVRTLVVARKGNERLEPGPLNAFLSKVPSALRLDIGSDEQPVLVRD